MKRTILYPSPWYSRSALSLLTAVAALIFVFAILVYDDFSAVVSAISKFLFPSDSAEYQSFSASYKDPLMLVFGVRDRFPHAKDAFE